MRVFANRAWLKDRWRSNVRLEIGPYGDISTVESDAAPERDDFRCDTLLPGLANLHSHSFQRAMAGMTEYRAAGKESFWTWRTLMYQFLDHLTPEHIGAIAALVFMEMQEAGYASVGEFHYVHHQPGGSFYTNPGELSLRIFSAAEKTGIGLTHLPVLYSHGGAGKKPLTGEQTRFGHTVGQFLDLVEALDQAIHQLPDDANLGVAPHSLRATSPEDLKIVAETCRTRPFHIHIAEQPREVEEISAWLGARPVEWLLNNHDVRNNWCLIHATHMTGEETERFAGSGAVAGLCPVTEANLGDGPFNGPQFLANGGKFGVGSDSNVCISLTEELRTLEYSQRLRDLQRNVFIRGAGSVGRTLYTGAAAGGAQALGRNAGVIEEGRLADLVAIDSGHPALCGLDEDRLFDGLCFAAKDTCVTDVWSAGRHMVEGGRHRKRDEIIAGYRNAVSDLKRRLSA